MYAIAYLSLLIVFECLDFGYPGGTRARVVHMTSQMSSNAIARKVYILVVVLILRNVYLVDVILDFIVDDKLEVNH